MHRLGDIVTVRLVEAAPLAGALRFELVSETAPPKAVKSEPKPSDRHAATSGTISIATCAAS
jgi:ribonuclease R